MRDPRPEYDLICLVTNDVSTDRRMIRTCDKLVSIGWSVLLVGRELPNSDELPTYSFDTGRVRCMFQSGPLFYIEILLRFRKLLKSYRYERLLCTDLDSLGVVNFIDSKHVKVFFDAHEYFTEVPELANARIKKAVWTWWGKLGIRHVDTAYTVGPELAKILARKYDVPFEVIRNVPEEIEFSPSPKKSDLLSIVYLGVLNPGRGLELLIDIVKGRANLKLTIIGNGSLDSVFRSQADNCPRISFTGQKSPSELFPILQDCDIGLNILETGSQSYYYSLANKFFDYIHSGLPVLCMNTPEYKAIAEEFDCIYPVHGYDIESINRALDTIHKTSPKWQSKVSQSLLAAKKYNWQIEGNKLLEVFGVK